MIINFKIKNFLSFKELEEFTFLSDWSHAEKTISYSKYELNKANILYGANASWKSNLFKGILFIKNMIIWSHDQSRSPKNLWYTNFLLGDQEEESFFEISFIVENEIYRYSFSIDPRTEKIMTESLDQYKSQKPTNLYKRIQNDLKSNVKEFEERKFLLRDNGLALSIFSNVGWEISWKIREFFGKKVHIFWPQYGNNPRDTIDMFNKHRDRFKNFLQNMLIAADINIKDIEYKTEKKDISEIPIEHLSILLNTPWFNPANGVIGVETKFMHSSYDEQGNVKDIIGFWPDQESTGTNKLADLSGSFFNVLSEGMVLFIDELDNSLHPFIIREIVNLFNSWKNKNSQLVFTSHDISLLDEDILANDQIWFVNKSKYGISQVYSLNEFKWLSSVKSLQKAYLQWRFDAVPKTTDFTI